MRRTCKFQQKTVRLSSFKTVRKAAFEFVARILVLAAAQADVALSKRSAAFEDDRWRAFTVALAFAQLRGETPSRLEVVPL